MLNNDNAEEFVNKIINIANSKTLDTSDKLSMIVKVCIRFRGVIRG